MYCFRNSIAFIVAMFVFVNLYTQEKKQILYSSTLDREDFSLGVSLFANKSDSNLIRAIVKVVPKKDSFKNSLVEYKTQVMFEKGKMLEVIMNDNEKIYANDYIYEEGHGYFYMIYTFLKIDFKSIKSISILDDLFTNSKKIVLL
jgi:hypothetical protein